MKVFFYEAHKKTGLFHFWEMAFPEAKLSLQGDGGLLLYELQCTEGGKKNLL